MNDIEEDRLLGYVECRLFYLVCYLINDYIMLNRLLFLLLFIVSACGIKAFAGINVLNEDLLSLPTGSARPTFVVNGYVTDDEGETLLSATVYDKESSLGTVTNSYGFYSLRLPEGKVSLKVSYVGYKEETVDFILKSDTTITISLHTANLLGEVYIDAEKLNSSLKSAQMGHTNLKANDFLSVPAPLGSPDLVRRLQMLPGVASGMEIVAGMYVRGGNSDENLFLIDGNPIYQINHLGGLFSSFNTDAIKTVDFYKGGFPARYGGRLSSVVDVRTKDGSMTDYHGVFTIGLIEGRFQFEGPIVKNRTSFNIALRRSWLDVLTVPGFAIYNRLNKDDKTKFRYAFHDLNAKVTHKFSDTNKLGISIYSGYDVLRISSETKEDDRNYSDRMSLGWGNIVSSLNWNYVFRPKLNGDVSFVYSQFKTKIGQEDNENMIVDKFGSLEKTSINESESMTVIRDVGYRANFDYRPSSRHHVRFGSDYLFHIFKPQKNTSYNYSKEENNVNELRRSSAYNAVHAHELAVYIEDEIGLFDWWNLNIGARGTLFRVRNKSYWSLEPRISTRFTLIPERLVFKTAYTEMSQYVHTLSTTYLSLPSDMWVPVTDRVKPMCSRLVSSGFSVSLPFDLEAEIEGYYKTISNVIDYRNTPRLTANYDSWEDNVISGNGRSYGLEFMLRRAAGKTSGEMSYTLSWTDRKFDEFWDGNWFPARFDNRHKFNISLAHRFNRKLEVFAAWTYATGNRVTVALENYQSIGSHLGQITSTEGYYEHPNNVQLPAYHRLDLGLNIYKKTKRGNEGIWNISIYNAYCRMNPIRVRVIEPNSYYYENGNMVQKPFQVRAEGIVPIIPSFSYTLKF